MVSGLITAADFFLPPKKSGLKNPGAITVSHQPFCADFQAWEIDQHFRSIAVG